jgi:hypothetical protein
MLTMHSAPSKVSAEACGSSDPRGGDRTGGGRGKSMSAFITAVSRKRTCQQVFLPPMLPVCDSRLQDRRSSRGH